MKAQIRGRESSPCLTRWLARVLIVAGFFLCADRGLAQLDPSDSYGPTNVALDSWTFYNPTNWTSDLGYAPVSYTNLSFSQLGNFRSLVVDTNIPAWLAYNVYESDGTTNLTVDSGTVMFWFAPGSWASTNIGGTGPGEWGRLFETGAYTTNSSYGWWSIYVDAGGNNLYFAAQTNDLSGTIANYITYPISWTNDVFHSIALTYSPTNTALYFDGVLMTNGPGVTVYPGPEALTNGLFIGADYSGVYQAHGLLDFVATYNYPLDSNDVQTIYEYEQPFYEMNPYNTIMSAIISAQSDPSTNAVTPDVITGAGYLQSDGSATPVYGTNAYQVWITNTTAVAVGDGSDNITFTIQGGLPGYYYDVFASGALTGPLSNGIWYWMGQGTNSGIYTLNITSGNAFLVLGTPLDTDGDGLTDAYELLVSHTNPDNPYSNLDGILDGWEVLLGLNPANSNFTSPLTRANYGYTLADWLNTVSGVKSGAISLDNEGNVQSVSQ